MAIAAGVQVVVLEEGAELVITDTLSGVSWRRSLTPLALALLAETSGAALAKHVRRANTGLGGASPASDKTVD